MGRDAGERFPENKQKRLVFSFSKFLSTDCDD